jgi:hypothetical protein
MQTHICLLPSPCHPLAHNNRRGVHGKSKSDFKTVRSSEDDWNIVAEYPGTDPREITGFKSKADVDDWMNGDRRVAWLRSHCYAK